MKTKLWIVVLMLVVSVFSVVVFADEALTVPEEEPATAIDVAVEALTAQIGTLEVQVADYQLQLDNPLLTDEERGALEAQIAQLTTEIETYTEQIASLLTEVAVETVPLTEAELAALEAQATELKTKIEEIEAQLADPNSTLDEAAKLLLVESLEALKTELVTVQTTLNSTEGDNPNALRFQNALLLGITPGKMHLLEKLMWANGTEEINLTEWAQKSVKEINWAVKELKKHTQLQESDEENRVTVESENTVSEKNKEDNEKKKEHSDKGHKGKK